jgi:acetylglutamate kinase
VRALVKVGGAQLEQPHARAELVRSVARARLRGHQLVLVHGGGNQIRALSRRLGIEDRYHEGLRITDADTADVVLMVLAGLVNKTLVAAFEAARVRACGLCGADGSTFLANRVTRPDVDLGWVGEVERCDPRLVEALLAAGILPVIATSAPGSGSFRAPSRAASGEAASEQRFYNVNADAASGPLAAAVDARALVFLTDVAGVLDADKRLLPSLSRSRAAELRAAGVITGGMIPKVEAALAALAASPRSEVRIAPAAGDDAVLAALEGRTGTRFEEDD